MIATNDHDHGGGPYRDTENHPRSRSHVALSQGAVTLRSTASLGYCGSDTGRTVHHSFAKYLSRENREANCWFWRLAYLKLFDGVVDSRVAVRGSDEQRAGIDRVLTLRDGSVVTVQEKVRSRPVRDLFIEFRHEGVDGRSWPGWIHKTTADFLLYVERATGRCRMWSMADLKRAWLYNGIRWQRIYGIRRAVNSRYASLNVAIPLSVLPTPKTCTVNPSLLRSAAHV